MIIHLKIQPRTFIQKYSSHRTIKNTLQKRKRIKNGKEVR
ncbi:MAG: hypothetical protein BSOLF_0330 [Candidatus Carbobacillus altaicus]|uniref:Uncharacterized protein n=1 Tax=Candidatus Carbonibacillus altaicus TaxID=2163959 RepID=A0A2R6Y0Z5_9BACL|nr:MAG: hypothetical protein BSOLF_0330 [Candidatus Carbobacillus altaicus]